MSGAPSSFEVNLGSIFGRLRGPQPAAERDSAGLPYTDPAVVTTLRSEYEEAAQLGGPEALEKCFKYGVWNHPGTKPSGSLGQVASLTVP